MSIDETNDGELEQMESLPDIARISFTAPLDWLKGAWSDLWKIPAQSLTYGLILAVISVFLTYGLFFTGHFVLILLLCGGFVFVGPMFAMGLYEAGRQLERGQTPGLKEMLFVKTNSTRCLCYLGLALLLFFFFWLEVGQIVYGISASRFDANPREFVEFMFTDQRGHAMALTGSIIGAVIAFFAYCIVVVTAPMLLERHTNVFMAVVTSVRSIGKNLAPMLLWAFLIAALTGLGIATGFLGLIIVFPWLGLASWRAYRALVDSPKHPDFQPGLA